MPEVLELGAISCNGHEQASFQALASPLGGIEAGATATHGLLWDQNDTQAVQQAVQALKEGRELPPLVELQQQPPFPVVLLSWLEWLTQQCSAAPGGSSRLVLTGHNIKA